MKYFTATGVVFSIMLSTLTACDIETDSTQKNSSSDLSTEKNLEVSITKDPGIESNNSSVQAPSSLEVNKVNEEKPFALTDFRNAINSVVEESAQDDVE